MNWTPNTNYRITYEDFSSVTFRIEGDIPSAMHRIRVRDLYTGNEIFLFELLLNNWIDLQRIAG